MADIVKKVIKTIVWVLSGRGLPGEGEAPGPSSKTWALATHTVGHLAANNHPCTFSLTYAARKSPDLWQLPKNVQKAR